MSRYELGLIAIACSLLRFEVACASDVRDRIIGSNVHAEGPAIPRDSFGSLGEQASRERLRRSFRARELAHRKTLQSVFAVTERQAEEKLIQKLLRESPAVGVNSPLSITELGFCNEQFTPTERETLAKSLETIELPARRLVLDVAPDDDPESHNRFIEQGHHILQATLGDDRYRSSYRQCKAQLASESEASDIRANTIFYQFFGLSPEQRASVAAVIMEEERKQAIEAGDQETLTQSELLNGEGRIPRLRDPEVNADATHESAQSVTQPQTDEEWARLDAEYADKIMKLLSPEQRALVREWATDFRSLPASGGMYRFLSHLSNDE